AGVHGEDLDTRAGRPDTAESRERQVERVERLEDRMAKGPREGIEEGCRRAGADALGRRRAGVGDRVMMPDDDGRYLSRCDRGTDLPLHQRQTETRGPIARRARGCTGDY